MKCDFLFSQENRKYRIARGRGHFRKTEPRVIVFLISRIETTVRQTTKNRDNPVFIFFISRNFDRYEYFSISRITNEYNSFQFRFIKVQGLKILSLFVFIRRKNNSRCIFIIDFSSRVPIDSVENRIFYQNQASSEMDMNRTNPSRLDSNGTFYQIWRQKQQSFYPRNSKFSMLMYFGIPIAANAKQICV